MRVSIEAYEKSPKARPPTRPDTASLKSLYLAIQDITAKWDKIQGWAGIFGQLTLINRQQASDLAHDHLITADGYIKFLILPQQAMPDDLPVYPDAVLRSNFESAVTVGTSWM